MLVDGDISRPRLRPFKIRIHSIQIKGLLQDGIIAGFMLCRHGIGVVADCVKIRIVSRVRNDIPDPNKRYAAGEDTGSSANLSGAVAANIPVKTNPWRKQRLCTGQISLIEGFRIIVFV